MNKRSREILSQLIKKNEYGQNLSIQNLAEMFDVSIRTIRYDINQVNDFLEDNGLNPVHLGNQGIIETTADIRKAKTSLMNEGFYSYKLSRDERLIFTAVLLIGADDYVTLSDIADWLYVSRSTVIQDLDHIKDFFRKHQLYLLSHSNKGLLLEGREREKRNMLFDLIQSHSSVFREKPVFQHLMDGLSKNAEIDMEDRTRIEKIINEAEHVYGRFLTDRSFIEIRTYFEIALYRLAQGHFVEGMGKKNSKYPMAQEIMQQIQQFIVKEVPETESSFLAEVLNRVKYIKKTTSNQEIVKMQVITRTFIENISKDIERNLQGDYIFYENLINHLESTFSAVGKGPGIGSVVDEVITRYPKVKDAVKRNVFVLEEYIGRKLSEEEIAYIVIHVCAALERNNNEATRYSVILVCNGGIGTSQLLLARLEKFFHLDVLDIIPAHDIKNVDLKNVDVVISTISLAEENIEYIQVDPLLTDEDCIRVGEKLSKIKPRNQKNDVPAGQPGEPVRYLEKIRTILEEEQQDACLGEIQNVIEEFFQKKEEILLTDLLRPQAITLDVFCRDWREAIRASAKYLLERGAVNPNYVEAMVRNVEENGPYIVLAPGFALPHEALNAGASKVGMSLIRLEQPVPFGKKEMDPIEWVCCLSAINKETHLKAMFHLVNLFYNPEFRRDIRKSTTPEEVFRIISQYEYETR